MDKYSARNNRHIPKILLTLPSFKLILKELPFDFLFDLFLDINKTVFGVTNIKRKLTY